MLSGLAAMHAVSRRSMMAPSCPSVNASALRSLSTATAHAMSSVIPCRSNYARLMDGTGCGVTRAAAVTVAGAFRAFTASALSASSASSAHPLLVQPLPLHQRQQKVHCMAFECWIYQECLLVPTAVDADVIKVENTSQGDDTRTWGPPFAPNKDGTTTSRESAYFLGVNRNKRSITVNFKTPAGIEIIKRLAAKADILVENYIPGKLDAMGLGYDALRLINPKLIYASITGYGPTGPYRLHAGYDLIIEAEAGLMHITGEKDGPPVKVGVAMTDIATGLYTHGAILAALFARVRTQVGQKIDSSLLECQVASLANISHSYLLAGQEATRWGTQHSAIVPYQAFPTQDGDIIIGVGNDKQFVKLCDAIGRPELATHAKFSTNSLRVVHRDELVDILCKETKKFSKQKLLDTLEPLGIPYGPVNNIAQTFAHPQVLHRKMVVEVEHPKSGTIKLVGIPVKYSHTQPTIRLPPPMLGEHTHSILVDELGFSEDDVAEFKNQGAI
ncbi:hypothetical protein BASA62_009155 [Batrachochytrium salamandrivorans]|nr:hypothetical protein BASA62_009155 [Batrachochytrium salamandrivorans]